MENTEINTEIKSIQNLGAFESPKDSRTIIEKASIYDRFLTKVSSVTDSYEIDKDVFSQNMVGICTCASIIANLWGKTGVRYSEDFLYFLLKKHIDNVVFTEMPKWFEGSAPIHSIKSFTQFGVVEKSLVDQYFIRNENENYETYMARMRQSFTPEIESLLLSKAEKIGTGYTQVNTDIASISQACNDKNAMVLHRFTCGNTWYGKPVNGVYQWSYTLGGEKIEPISEPYNTPTIKVSGHQVSGRGVRDNLPFIKNTFGKTWTGDGHAPIEYLPTETWKVYINKISLIVKKEKLPSKTGFRYFFGKNLYMGVFNKADVEALQTVLMYENCIDFIAKNQRGYFGIKTFNAVKNFQLKYNISQTGFVGVKTLAKLNELYKI